MSTLRADVIAVPLFEGCFLDEGLAVHFRCQAAGVEGLRVNIMTRMRGVEDFDRLWNRRFTIEDGLGGEVNLLNVRDLVAAKKTQRDKDWPMIQRLMEVQYLGAAKTVPPEDEETRFWLQELRTAELLIDAAERFPVAARAVLLSRRLLQHAIHPDRSALERGLNDEMLADKEIDRLHWEPLKTRLHELRHAKGQGGELDLETKEEEEA